MGLSVMRLQRFCCLVTLAACSAEPTTGELDQFVLGNSTNARLISTATNPTPFQPMVLSPLGEWQNWSRRYHRAIAAGSDRVAFYNRLDGVVRIMQFTAAGGASVVSTNSVVAGYDEFLYGEFGGSTARKDLLLFSRDTGNVKIYEIQTSGAITLVRSTTLAGTSQGGRWDLITSGYLGQTNNVDDLVVYNKAEGRLRIYRDTPAGYLPVTEHVGLLSRTFDQVVAGKFDGDNKTDFAFYNQDGGGVVGTEDLVSATNPLNGHLRIMSFANVNAPVQLSESFDAWPMHRNVILVPGEFGGDSRTDLIAYTGEPDGTSRATYWINGGTGGLIPIGTDSSWQGRWNSIVALNVDGGSRSDLFLYTRQVEVKLIAVADRDSGGPKGIPENDVTLHAQFAAQIAELNASYAPSGIYFTLNDDVAEIDLDDVDGHDVTSSSSCWNSSDPNRAAMAAWTSELRTSYPKHIPVIMRNRSRGSGGCSSVNVDFVLLRRPMDFEHDHYTRASSVPATMFSLPKHLGHELGHFFALHHSQPGSWIAAPASRYGYDSDTNNSVWDTPPNPSSKASEDRVVEPSPWDQASNPCDDSGGNNLTIDAESGSYTLNPERHDMMAKGDGWACGELYRISPDQARAIHEGYYARTWLSN